MKRTFSEFNSELLRWNFNQTHFINTALQLLDNCSHPALYKETLIVQEIIKLGEIEHQYFYNSYPNEYQKKLKIKFKITNLKMFLKLFFYLYIYRVEVCY